MFLSTEKFPPNDPPSPSTFLHLTTSCDELGQSHLPNFSIRGYVCSYRSKDIKNNWPFSLKSLQLCLRRGVNDPLPPLQPPGAVGNQCGEIPPSEASSLEKQIIPNVELKLPSCFSEKSKLDNLGSNQTLTETRKGVESSSLCQFGVENDLLPSISASSEIKVATINKNPGKKCGLLLKSGACLNRGSKEDNCLATSESMASKTCPICKTFSSASNTTLNAHIDQCLSVDSALPTTKPNRHRIKPRRVRTMTDIYATAKGCTLEELDKRNGTMWAMISSYSNRITDKPEVSRKGKKRQVLPARLDEDAIGVGPVYVDPRGKKLRILSEFRENSSSRLRENKDANLKKKSSKEGKGSKWCSTRKKGQRGKKHHKYLRLIPQSRKLISQKANASKIPEYQEGHSGEGSMERTQTPKQFKPGQPRILNQKMLAKRSTGMSRKLNKIGHKFHASRDQPSENEDSWSADQILSRTHKLTDLSVSVSSSLNKQKIWKTCEESQDIGKNETIFRRKYAQSSSFRVCIADNKERSLVPVQHDNGHSTKNLASIRGRHSAGEIVATDAARYADASPGASSARMLSPVFAAKASRFSMPVDKLPISEAKAFRKLKKARIHLSQKEDEELEKWDSEMAQERALMDDDSDSGKTDEVLMKSNSSISGKDDYDDDESSEDDANREGDAMDKTDGADAEFYQSDTPPSTEICNGSTSPGDRGMYYSEEVGDMVYYGQTASDGADPDSRVGQGSSFMESDPIPIPGPPGSFLPSPRDMGSDDYPGNSSVITGQVQSSHDLLDLTDRNSSESPLSVDSTHSNSEVVRFTHANLPAEFSSAQEMITSDYPTSYSEIPMGSAASSQQANAEPERSSDTGKFTLRSITVDKRSFPFSNNDQPCCCQRKERFPEGFTVNNRESQLLKRRAASSITIPETRTPKCLDSNIMLSDSDAYLDTFESDIFQDSDLQSKFSNGMNRAATSPSNPVLRLMGKDLMVVNQGEQAPTPTSHNDLSLRQTPQCLDPSGPFESSIQTFHHTTPHTLLQSPCVGTNVYCGPSLYFGNDANSATPQTPAEGSADAFRNSFGLVRYFSPT